MPYALNPKFIDHIVLMVKNVYKSEVFYSKFLGKPISKDKYSIAYKIGGTKLFFAIPFKHIKSNTFNRNRLGLNHIAFGVSSLKTLKNIENRLNKAKIKTPSRKKAKQSHIYQHFIHRPATDVVWPSGSTSQWD